MTNAPILVLPDFSLIFDLHLDAFKLGIGTMLSWNGRPMAYLSEKLSSSKLKYNMYDVQFYAMVQAIHHWRHYLFHQKFILYTDNDAL